MRSTMKIATNTTIDNILDNYSRVLKVQNQMAKGRRVLDPSDDPLATNEGIRIQTVLAQIDQFERNINVGESFLGLSDSALQAVNDLETKARGLTTGMASDTTTPAMRRGNVQEIHSILQEMVTIGNRKVGNRHIFAGTETADAPFAVAGAKYVHFTGNEEDIDIQVDQGAFTPANVKASDVFGTLVTTMRSEVITPDANVDIDTSTRLEALNRGSGVSPGSIQIEYWDNASGSDKVVEIDLRSADTLEDVVDIIERSTDIGAGPEIDVAINAAHDGLVLTNTIAGPPGPVPDIRIKVTEVASNTTAHDLGIFGQNVVGTNIIDGDPVDPALTEDTLLADIPGYYGTPLTIVTGSDNLSSPSFQETDDPSNHLDQYALVGLAEGVNTDLEGELYFSVNDLGGGDWEVEAFMDDAKRPQDRVAVGSVTGAGVTETVTLTPDNGSGVSGTVRLNTTVAGNSEPQVNVVFPDDFRGQVHVEAFREEAGTDDQNQLSAWSLQGLRRGEDTDADGKMYIDLQDVGAGGPYQVDVYADSLKTELVATGQLAGPSPNGQVTLAGVGTHAHVAGSVDLEYLADDTDIELTATFATVEDFTRAVEESGTYTTARVSDDGEALQVSSRLAGATLHLIQDGPVIQEQNEDDQLTRWNLNGIQAGVNSGPDGELYGEYVQDPATLDYTLNLYKDAARDVENLVATTGPIGGPLPQSGVVINEVNQSGINGSVDFDSYAADDTDFVLQSSSLGLTGKNREENIFSTLVDVIEAGTGNDTERLHQLIGNFEVDEQRVLDGRAEIGAKLERFEMLHSRHEDEKVSFGKIFAERIDLDYADAIVKFQAESNVFNASLSVAGRIIPMSLVDFI